MPRLFRFPFRFGSVSDASSVVTTPASPSSPGGVASRWASISGTAARWAGGAAAIRQFHRIHVQTAQTFGASVNFAYRVNDAFPLKVRDNGDHIHVASTITNP
jgi:hypothetical protein